MAGTTARYAFRFPGALDPTNVPGDIQNLAQDIDDFIAANVVRRGTGLAAARPVAAAGNAGLMWYATDTGIFSLSDGAAWHPWPDLSTFITAAAATTQFVDAAGDSMTGDLNLQDHLIVRPEVKDAAETLRTVAVSGAAQTVDYTVAAVQDITLDQNCTLTFTNPPASGKSGSMLLIIRQPGALKTVTFPASVKWANGAAPVMAINTVNTLSFLTVDGGATWLGFVAGLDHH